MICKNCGKVFSYMKSDIKAGRIKDPTLCPACSKVGKVERMTETYDDESKYFKGSGIEGKKRKKKKGDDVPESVDVNGMIEDSIDDLDSVF